MERFFVTFIMTFFVTFFVTRPGPTGVVASDPDGDGDRDSGMLADIVSS
jgi:hypothetical protein